MLCQGSLNISFLELVSLFCLGAILYGGCVPTGQSATSWQFVKSFFFFFPAFSLCFVWKLICLSAALGPPVRSQHSSLVQCLRPCAPRRVSLSDKYNQGHPPAPSLRPVGAWQSPHNNSVLMEQLSQNWVGGGALFLCPQRTSGLGVEA